MVITWYGQSCFKIQSGDLVIAVDPFSKAIGLTPPRFRADLALITHSHFDHSNVEAIGGNPFIIRGPGEYDVKAVYIRGIASFHDKEEGRTRGPNTIYLLEAEDLKIAHLGDFGEKELRDQTLEEIGEVEIAFIPVGGTYTLDAVEAAKVAKQIEPKMVVPMHYKIPGLSADISGLEPFLKEMGGGSKAAVEKLTVKKKDFTEEGKMEIAVLKPSGS